MTTQTLPARTDLRLVFSLPVIVAGLGYFVDVYDLILFSIVRVQSLKDLGLSEAQISTVGVSIYNWQMAGLLLGGILWGVLGDRRGRLSVLFGSIITYSLANIACGFVKQVSFMPPTDYYALMRFVAGVGLAGELGAGITLVSEILPTRLRAIGTSLVVSVGVMGPIAAYFTVRLFEWETAFLVGGGLGIGLLLLRVGVVESGLFRNMTGQTHVQRGNFFALFTNRNRLSRYLKCVAIGLPGWFFAAILVGLSNEFGQVQGLSIRPDVAILWYYAVGPVGDLAGGLLSQTLRSRIRAITVFLTFGLFVCGLYLFGGVKSVSLFYVLCGLLGLSGCYWAVIVTVGAEQFGTNLRATAATTIPGMIRGTVILMTSSYLALKPSLGVMGAGAVVGAVCFGLASYSVLTLPETHGKELNFVEE